MFNYHHFDEVFSFDPECSYNEAALQRIAEHRTALEGLFLDGVLKFLGMKRPVKVYPPKTNGDLKTLHKTITESTGADHHKISALYYLLLDFDASVGTTDISMAFERASFLPHKYQIYMKGLWYMDQLQFVDALEYLTYPSLIPDFADEILEALVRNSKSTDLSLPLAYYHTVQPALKTSKALESLFSAITRTSVTEAFYFCRGQPEHAQQHMFEMLVSLVLNNSPAKTIAGRSVELVNLPFTREEEEWFEEYLLRGEGRSIRKGRDTLMMRWIGTGNLKKSLSFKGMNTREIGGLNWGTLIEGIGDGLGSRLDV